MSVNPSYYPQEGQTFQRPVKKRKHRFLKVMAILLVITVLSMTVVNNFVEPVFISRLTKGFIFGFHTTRVTEDALMNPQSITKPTDKEIRDFSKYAKKASDRIYLSLNSAEKEDFQEIKDGAKKLAAYKRQIFGQNLSDHHPLAASNIEKTKSTKNSTSLLYFDLASVALGGSNTTSVKDKKEREEDIFDPDTLNQISTILYANGYPDLAAAVSSMTAAVYPDDPNSALTFATILREGNADEDAFNVLQYALRLDPDSEPILYSLGMCALDLRDTSYAETCFFKILSMNPSSGPGHQGMMLCYMDTGNYSSAFLHMIEGAREGYTTMVTETYKALRQNPNEYMKIAESIFAQYSFEQLLDFSKSRTPFDDTLDTPENQLEIPREINLGRDSAGVYAASGKMQEGLQYAMTALSHAKATFSDAFGLIPSEDMADLIGGLGMLLQQGADEAPDEILKPVSKSILDRIFGSAATGTTVSPDGWLNISYEQETFWLNILNDYVQVKQDELIEEYLEQTYDDVFEKQDSVTPSLDQYHEILNKLCENDPIQAASMVLNNLINNNSVYDSGVQKADKNDMDKFLQTVNPRLEEGYQKTAELMELYWLHSSSILGQIGHDETYNRYQQHRKTVVASALTPYVLAGTINCFMVTMNFIAVDSDNMGSGASIKYPEFPDFPDSQMGDPYIPPKPQINDPVDEPPIDEPVQEEDTPEQQQENPGLQETPDSDSPEPGSEKPGTGDIITEDTITIFIGPLSITVNQKTGYEVDLTAIGSVNLRYDKRTGDITLFGGVGLSAGVATSGVSARLGIYGTINPRKMSLVSSGTRGTLDGQLAGNGIAVENQTCFATGADETTVSAILLHKKSSETIHSN